MRIISTGGVDTFIDLQEGLLYDRINESGKLYKNDLDERANVMAMGLVSRNVLARFKDDAGIYYQIKNHNGEIT